MDKPCPACGHCPTCGRGGYQPDWTWRPQPWINPYPGTLPTVQPLYPLWDQWWSSNTTVTTDRIEAIAP